MILQTRLSPDNAQSLITESLESTGYEMLVPYQPGTGEHGFVYRDRMPAPPGNRLCHDSFGNMTIDTMPGQNRLLVALTASRAGSANAARCEALRAQSALQANNQFTDGDIDQYMPKLELPDEALQSRPTPMLRSFSPTRVRSESQAQVTIDIEWPIDRLFEHFTRQLRQQGWRLDSSANGDVSASSTWMLSPDANINLVGTLSALQSGEDRYDLKFRISYLSI